MSLISESNRHIWYFNQCLVPPSCSQPRIFLYLFRSDSGRSVASLIWPSSFHAFLLSCSPWSYPATHTDPTLFHHVCHFQNRTIDVAMLSWLVDSVHCRGICAFGLLLGAVVVGKTKAHAFLLCPNWIIAPSQPVIGRMLDFSSPAASSKHYSASVSVCV